MRDGDQGAAAAGAYAADHALTRSDALRLAKLASLARRSYQTARILTATDPAQFYSANERRQAIGRRQLAKAAAAEGRVGVADLARWHAEFDAALARAEAALADVRRLLDPDPAG
jgi:hypothetical protein